MRLTRSLLLTTGNNMSPALAPIVFGIDDHYVGPLCTAITSLAASNPLSCERFCLFFLYEELSHDSLQLIRHTSMAKGISATAIQIPHKIPNYGVYRWPSATYLRLTIPALLPDERVALYLDTDVLILDDLTPLLTTDLQSNFVGAVRDSLSPTFGQATRSDWSDLGVREDREYFNAGVMLMNLEAWRKHDISKQCHDFLATFPQYISHPDQDALNYVLRDSWLRLHHQWNTFAASALLKIGWLAFDDDGTRQRQLLKDEKRARILHYAGPKPWLPDFPDSYALRVYQSFAPLGDIQSAPDTKNIEPE